MFLPINMVLTTLRFLNKLIRRNKRRLNIRRSTQNTLTPILIVSRIRHTKRRRVNQASVSRKAFPPRRQGLIRHQNLFKTVPRRHPHPQPTLSPRVTMRTILTSHMIHQVRPNHSIRKINTLQMELNHSQTTQVRIRRRHQGQLSNETIRPIHRHPRQTHITVQVSGRFIKVSNRTPIPTTVTGRRPNSPIRSGTQYLMTINHRPRQSIQLHHRVHTTTIITIIIRRRRVISTRPTMVIRRVKRTRTFVTLNSGNRSQVKPSHTNTINRKHRPTTTTSNTTRMPLPTHPGTRLTSVKLPPPQRIHIPFNRSSYP